MPVIAPIDARAHVEWAGFLGDAAVFALADGDVVFAHGGERRIAIDGGVSLAALSMDGGCLLVGGQTGALSKVHPSGVVEIASSANGKWVTAIASGPSGSFALATGKQGAAVLAGGKRHEFASERTIEAMAFAPKGLRLALARYNGVELLWPGTDAPAQFMEWKGAHVGVTFSPDGRFVVSAMQENALHGWRIADVRNMRMTGYPAKVKSLSWSAKGRWLASSGAPAAIVWPFSGKDGPMGKAPKELGGMGQIMVTRVACHPAEDIIAIGYQNGMVLAVRIADGKEVVLRRGGEGAICALGWGGTGRRIAFGAESGEAGIIDIAG